MTDNVKSAIHRLEYVEKSQEKGGAWDADKAFPFLYTELARIQWAMKDMESGSALVVTFGGEGNKMYPLEHVSASDASVFVNSMFSF